MGEKIIVHIDADLKEIVPRFFELRHDDIDSIGRALEESDFETIKRIGHSMKGSGASYGFDHISDIGRGIEEGAKRKDTDTIKKWGNELSTYIDNIEVIYD